MSYETRARTPPGGTDFSLSSLPQPTDRPPYRRACLNPASRFCLFPTSLPHPFVVARLLLTPTESYSFARITPKPNGILLFQYDPRAWGPLTSSIENPLEQSSAPSSK